MRVKRQISGFLLVLIGVVILSSCEMIMDANGVNPVEIQVEVIDGAHPVQTDLPQLDYLQLDINSLSLYNEVDESYYLSPQKKNISLTSENRSQVLLSDYIPKDQFLTFAVNIDQFSPSINSQQEAFFLKGRYQEQDFSIELPDTLHLSYDFLPSLDFKNKNMLRPLLHSKLTGQSYLQMMKIKS